MDDSRRLAIEFAHYAATAGWTRRALAQFCEQRGIPDSDRDRRWPDGPRSLGWSLNDNADDQMLADLIANGPRPLPQIMLQRFHANAALKSAVRSLAWSDVFGPVGTLRRTAKTANLMGQCSDPTWPPAPPWRFVQVWALVLAYSLCVLVWLGDRTADLRPTGRAIRLLTAPWRAG